MFGTAEVKTCTQNTTNVPIEVLQQDRWGKWHPSGPFTEGLTADRFMVFRFHQQRIYEASPAALRTHVLKQFGLSQLDLTQPDGVKEFVDVA